MAQGECYFVGLDLGRLQDHTALAVLERPWATFRDPPHLRRPAYALRHLRRFPPGTHYAAVTAAVRDLLRRPELSGAGLVVDQTGVGRAVVDLLADGLRFHVDCTFIPVTLSAGHEVTTGAAGGVLVPKKELVGTLQILLQTRRLLVPRTLSNAAILVKELEEYRPDVTLARDVTAESWREGAHDDLVFAVGLAAWVGEQNLPALVNPPPEYERIIVV